MNYDHTVRLALQELELCKLLKAQGFVRSDLFQKLGVYYLRFGEHGTPITFGFSTKDCIEELRHV